MSYNTDRRKPLRKEQRQAFLESHGSICYYCHKPILPGQAWHDEHIIAKELMAPGSDWNDMSNRAPIHADPCHKEKTAHDIKLIAKSNRIRRAHGPKEGRKKKTPIRSRGFAKGHRPLKSRNTFKDRKDD